jgi:hypothetical protein
VAFYDIAPGGPVQTIPGSEPADTPSLHGTHVVWARWISEDARDICWCDLADPGLTIMTIDLNPGDDFSPDISDSIIVWAGEGPTLDDYEIYYYNLESGSPLYFPNPTGYDFSPMADAPFIVWYGWDGTDYEIALFDTELYAGSQITNNPDDDIDPYISGSAIVWQGWDGEDWEIFLCDAFDLGLGIVQLTDNTWDDLDPVVESFAPGQATVAWYAWDEMEEDWDIWCHYDPWEVPGGEPVEISQNPYDDYNPRISDQRLIWYGWDGEDWEIFYSPGPGEPPIQMTYNTRWDQHPSLQDNRIVWECDDGEDYEICSSVISLTGITDPQEGFPAGFAFGHWSPNPLESSSTIAFALPEAASVGANIYDLLGRRVATLTRRDYGAGQHWLSWDGRDDIGQKVAAGTYFCRIEAGSIVSVRRLAVLK